jgi:hypothetical protein
MISYELHEFDPAKIMTGEINPDKIEPIKFPPFEKDSKGMTVIDKNQDVSSKRILVNLNTQKTSQTKFNQVIDVEFAEFTRKDSGAPINFLQAKIDALETERQTLLSSKQTDAQKIKALNDRIAQLLEQMKTMIQNPGTPTVNAEPESNKVSNILRFNKRLISRKIENGIPADRLLSKNKKYIAVMQDDRNFVVYKGEFDIYGQAIKDIPYEADWASNTYSPTTNTRYLLVYGYGLGINLVDNGTEDTFAWVKQIGTKDNPGISDTGTLLLTDESKLVLTNYGMKVWSNK